VVQVELGVEVMSVLPHPFKLPIADTLWKDILGMLTLKDILKLRLLSTSSWDWICKSMDMMAYWRAEYKRVVGDDCQDPIPCRALLRHIANDLFKIKAPTDETIAHEASRLRRLRKQIRELRQKAQDSKKKLRMYNRRKRAEPFRTGYRLRVKTEDALERLRLTVQGRTWSS
jgi:hypothetical protein